MMFREIFRQTLLMKKDFHMKTMCLAIKLMVLSGQMIDNHLNNMIQEYIQ